MIWCDLHRVILLLRSGLGDDTVGSALLGVTVGPALGDAEGSAL